MKIDLQVVVPFSPRQVFSVYRDRLPELVAWLPSIASVEVKDLREEGPLLHQTNLWRGGGDIPAMLRRFVSADLLEWYEHISWNQDTLVADWKALVPAFSHAVRAEGRHRLEALSESATRLSVHGELEVDGLKVAQLPRMLARSVGPLAERFLSSALRQNLEHVSTGIIQFLSRPT